MKKWAIILLALVFFEAGCAAGNKIIVKGTGEEISELEQMQSGLENMAANGPMARAKEVIIDQLKRTENGIKNGNITDTEGAEIIAKAQELIDKIGEMAQNAGSYSGGQHGSGGGGGGGGHGHGKHGADSGDSGNSDHQGRQSGFLELKHMIDEYYGNTVTASSVAAAVSGTAAAFVTGTAQAVTGTAAVFVTGTAAIDSTGNTTAQGTPSK
jgi:hypothetical protein